MFLLRPALLRRDQPETGEHFHPGGAGVPPIQERQDGPQCLEDIDILFAGRDNKTAGSGEEFGAIPTSEATRDFLFDFHHSNIPLGEVVVKWHFKIVEEPQNIIGVISDAFYEVSGLGFFIGASFFDGRRLVRVGFEPLLYDSIIELSIAV